MTRNAIVIVGLGVALACAGVRAQQSGPFTAAQAAAGRAVYEQACAECHLGDLRGSAHGSELAGVSFMSVWGARTAGELFEHTRSEMPPGAGGSLPDEAYLNLVAYILQANGVAAGAGSPPPAAAAAAGGPGQPSEAQSAGLVIGMPSARCSPT